MMKQPHLIGITGPSASGKSTVSSILRKHGYAVIDADQVARTVMAPQKPVLFALANVFGCDILHEDGSLNRRKLGDRAFASKESTILLNQTTFPFIKEEISTVIAEYSAEKYLFLDAPTLIESGLHAECAVVVAVLAAKDLRTQRLLGRESDLSPEQVIQRIEAQPSDEFYRSAADFVLENITLDSLEEEVLTLLEKIKVRLNQKKPLK